MPDEIKKVSIYDPTVDAYREVPEENARQFVESAKEVEAQLPPVEEQPAPEPTPEQPTEPTPEEEQPAE